MRTLFIILCLLSATAAAQDNYIVTIKGDTLRGKVVIHSYDLIDRASVKGEGKKMTFTAVEVSKVYLDSTLYVPVQYDNRIQLMKVIKAGYLSLYGFKLSQQNSYDARLLSKMSGEKIEVPNLQFKRLMTNFTEDCEEVSGRVNSGELGRKNIEAIVDDYNNCIKEKNQKTVIAASTSSPLTEAIYNLRVKVDSSAVESKKEVLDILSTMDAKARLKESIPGYLKDGLKSYLTDKKEFENELNAVFALLI